MNRLRRRMVLVLLAVLVTAIALGACGSSGNVDQVKASFTRFVGDLQRRDAAGVCNEITPAFWSALAGEVNTRLGQSGQSVPTDNCRAGLQQVFKLSGGAAIVRSGFSIIDVTVRSSAATARQAIN